MVSLKQKQSGFTIVELLIVIVIIGILATLVIVTFSGVQQKARDSERKTDINAVANVLEAFYANKGYYPDTAEINSDPATAGTWRNINAADFKVDMKSFADPKNAATQTLTDGALVAGTYNYFYAPSGCSGTAPDRQCTGYVLETNLENTSGGSTFKRESV